MICMSSQKRICNSCGAKNGGERRLCRLCGHQFDLNVEDEIRTATIQRRRMIEDKADYGTKTLVGVGLLIFLLLASAGYYFGVYRNEYIDRGRVTIAKQFSEEYVGWEIIQPEGEPIQAGLPQGSIEQKDVSLPGLFTDAGTSFEGKNDKDSPDFVEFMYGNVSVSADKSWYGRLEDFADTAAKDLGGTVVGFDAAEAQPFTKSSFGIRYQGKMEPTEFFMVYEQQGRIWAVRSNSSFLFETASRLIGPPKTS